VCWFWFLSALVEPERWVAVGHQACVADDAEHPTVEADDEIEQRSWIPAREQKDHRSDHDQERY
jgi:hypothetical protein